MLCGGDLLGCFDECTGTNCFLPLWWVVIGWGWDRLLILLVAACLVGGHHFC